MTRRLWTRGLLALVMLCAALLALAPGAALAHVDSPTLILVREDSPDAFSVKIDVDLSLILGSSAEYYAFVRRNPANDDKALRALAVRVQDQLPIFVGSRRLALDFKSFKGASWAENEEVDTTSAGKRSTFLYTAAIPRSTDPMRVEVPIAAPIEFPIAFTAQVPAKDISITRWLVTGMRASDGLDWVNKPRDTAGTDFARGDPSRSDQLFDPDALSWWNMFRVYIQLGFRHIVPEGTDHILFVIGLYFLGASWRYILSQTSIFTVAHATTLFLSTYGIFRLPPQYVEPLIALSIAVIGFENIFRPRLGAVRLGAVFVFGLIHGLGFAASLSDVPFPKNDFIMALLGFNIGVDIGQLAIILVLFVLLGWARNKPWYRARLAIPASLAIGSVGLIWAVERIVLYQRLLGLDG